MESTRVVHSSRHPPNLLPETLHITMIALYQEHLTPNKKKLQSHSALRSQFHSNPISFQITFQLTVTFYQTDPQNQAAAITDFFQLKPK